MILHRTDLIMVGCGKFQSLIVHFPLWKFHVWNDGQASCFGYDFFSLQNEIGFYGIKFSMKWAAIFLWIRPHFC